jgi:hypothetical protein
MSARAFQTIWSWVALVALLVSVLGFLRTTGVEASGAGTPLEPSGLLTFKPSEVSTVLLPLQLALMALLLKLTQIWTEEVGRSHWATRLPVFFFKDSEIHPSKLGGRRYQLIALIVLLWLPLIATMLFMMSYLQATIYFSPKGPFPPYSTEISGISHFNTPKIYASAHGQPGSWRLGAGSGPEYFPILTWAYAAALLALLIYFARVAVFALFFRRNPGIPRLIFILPKSET